MSIITSNTDKVQYINIYSTQCPNCKQECNGSKHFFAIGHPYYCLMHTGCAPHYGYNGSWPHPYPAQYYLSQTNTSIQRNETQPSSTISTPQPSASPIHSSGSHRYCSGCGTQWN